MQAAGAYVTLRSSKFDVLLSPGCRLVLQEYDIYVAAIVDGDSRMCCALTALTNKLPITIYLFVLLGFLHEFGYPNQLVTDRGNEFRLCAFACMAVQSLTGYGGIRPRPAHKCTKSTSNVRIRPSPPYLSACLLTSCCVLTDPGGEVQH